jgi:protein TonB
MAGAGVATPLLLVVVSSLIFTMPAMAADESVPGFDLVQRDYDRLIADGEYLEAANSIKLILSTFLQDPDHDRLVYGQLLTQLATAQHLAGSYSAAIENFELAVEAIEFATDRLNGELVAPLLGMSRSLMGAGRYLEAEKTYHHTLHVHQVNYGFFGLDKAEIVNELSEAYFIMGDFESANNMQKSYVGLVENHYPGKNLERVPSLTSQAEMLYRSQNAFRALNAYRRLIALIEDADGPDSMELIPPLTGISDILINNRIIDGEDGAEKAMRYLRRAAAITEKNESASELDKANVFIMMGDFLSIQTPDRDAVVSNYKRGWQYLDGNPDLHAYRDEAFNNAILLNPNPGSTAPAMRNLLDDASDPLQPKNGHIIVGYDVNEGGRPENVRVVESAPPGLHDYIVKNYVRDFAFRPRFEAGQPVRSPNQTFELRYTVGEEELPEELRQNMNEVAKADATQ